MVSAWFANDLKMVLQLSEGNDQTYKTNMSFCKRSELNMMMHSVKTNTETRQLRYVEQDSDVHSYI